MFSVLKSLPESTSHCALLLQQVASKEPVQIIPYMEAVVSNMGVLVNPAVPRKLLEITQALWKKLNVVTPRE